jgi:uncharacterized membrane protein
MSGHSKKEAMLLNKKTILFFLTFLLLITIASAKSYTLEKAKIDMVVNDDGSVSVKEYITFNFQGSFTFAYRDIEYENEIIEGINVYEYTMKGGETPLRYETSGSNPLRVTWYYTANNEQRTFLISYKLKNAIKNYNDVSEFYWKIWGSGWDYSLKEIEGNFELPKEVNDSKEVYTWGHPQLEGKIAMLQNKTVIFQAFNIPSQQWVELRVAFPSNLLTNPIFTQRINSDGLQSIIAEEENYAEPFRPKPFNIYIFLAPVIGIIILFLILYIIFGMEPKTQGYHGVYERDIPYDYSPAIVSSLINQATKKPSINDFTAVILNLCLKGHLKLRVLKKKKILGMFGSDKDYEIIFQKKDASKLAKHERMVLDILKHYTEGNSIKLTELKEKVVGYSVVKKGFSLNAYTEKAYFRLKYMEWEKQVKKEAEEHGFFGQSKASMIFNITSIALIPAGAIFIFLTQNFSYTGLFTAGFIGLMINNVFFRNALPRRTEKGALHYKKWMNLKKFLKDFSLIKERPPESIVLWEQFLVYGVTLGVSKEVQKAMEIILPDQNIRSGIFVGGVNYHTFNLGGFTSGANSFSSAFASASGTSGSGGFGGGGGGGGGVGGGGAG